MLDCNKCSNISNNLRHGAIYDLIATGVLPRQVAFIKMLENVNNSAVWFAENKWRKSRTRQWGESFDWLCSIPVDTCFLQSQLNRSQSKPNYETTCRGIRGWKRPGSAGSLPLYTDGESGRCWQRCTSWCISKCGVLHCAQLCFTVLHCDPLCSGSCCSLLIEEALVRGCWMCRFNEHGFRCHSRSSSTRSSCRIVWVLEMASENSPQCYVLE